MGSQEPVRIVVKEPMCGHGPVGLVVKGQGLMG